MMKEQVLNNNEKIIFKAGQDGGLTPVLSSLLVAQAKHESANFKSRIFKVNNNAFGYKVFKGSKWQATDPTPDKSPELNNYAYYSSLYNSAREVAAWIKRRWPDFKTVTTPDQYAAALKKHSYYGDTASNYTNALKKFYKFIAGAPPVVPMFLVLFVAAVIIYNLKN